LLQLGGNNACSFVHYFDRFARVQAPGSGSAVPLLYPDKFMDIVQQLGGLVLGSVPTMIFFILLVILYGVLVRHPLEKTLAERRARTIGAVEQARGAISAAEAETQVYEDKLRAARADVVAAREHLLQQWHAERDAALEEVRGVAQDKVRESRKQIEASAVAARQQIESATDMLSDQILRAILPKGANVTEAHQ
jgi:F-type H+-transporting ATPase subunit b